MSATPKINSFHRNPCEFAASFISRQIFYPAWIFRKMKTFILAETIIIKNEISCNRDLHILKVKTEKSLKRRFFLVCKNSVFIDFS